MLLDIPRLHGVDYLEPGTAIQPDDLAAACQAQGVEVGEGDILLVVTGRDARRAETGPWHPFAGGSPACTPSASPGSTPGACPCSGSDGVSDVLPGLHPEGWPMPVHQCVLVAMGVHLLDNLRLDRLAAACARHGQWSFLFTVAPLVIEGGTGSPANPIAVL